MKFLKRFTFPWTGRREEATRVYSLCHRIRTGKERAHNSLEITGLGSIMHRRINILLAKGGEKEGESLPDRVFPARKMAGLGRMSIPGFYYDEGRNRYFRLRPGEKPPKLAQTEKEVNRKEASAAKGDVASSTCSLHHCILQREYNGLVSGSRRLRYVCSSVFTSVGVACPLHASNKMCVNEELVLSP